MLGNNNFDEVTYGDWSKFPIVRGPIFGSHYNTGPYINFPHFGNSNLGKLPYIGVSEGALHGSKPGSEPQALNHLRQPDFRFRV